MGRRFGSRCHAAVLRDINSFFEIYPFPWHCSIVISYIELSCCLLIANPFFFVLSIAICLYLPLRFLLCFLFCHIISRLLALYCIPDNWATPNDPCHISRSAIQTGRSRRKTMFAHFIPPFYCDVFSIRSLQRTHRTHRGCRLIRTSALTKTARNPTQTGHNFPRHTHR